MKLNVSYHDSVPESKLVWYKITPAEKVPGDGQKRFLEQMESRIRNMAKHILGESFHSYKSDYHEGMPGICVSQEISSEKQHALFRDLIGWINIFSEEIGMAMRLSMPRAN